jgi:hypothetical protein
MSKTPDALAPPLKQSNRQIEKKHYLVLVSPPQDPQDQHQHQQNIQTESEGSTPSSSDQQHRRNVSFREVLNNTIAGVLTLKGTEVESSTSKRGIEEEEDDRYEVMKVHGSKRHS